jgi:hypothetical protein
MGGKGKLKKKKRERKIEKERNHLQQTNNDDIRYVSGRSYNFHNIYPLKIPTIEFLLQNLCF